MQQKFQMNIFMKEKWRTHEKPVFSAVIPPWKTDTFRQAKLTQVNNWKCTELGPIDGEIWNVLLISADLLSPSLTKLPFHTSVIFRPCLLSLSAKSFYFLHFSATNNLLMHRPLPFISLYLCSAPLPPRNPPINAKKTQGFLPWVSFFVQFYLADLGCFLQVGYKSR